MPPLQPSLIVNGALLQLEILNVGLPFTFVSRTVKPLPCEHFKLFSITLGSLPEKIIFLLLINNSSPASIPVKSSLSIVTLGVINASSHIGDPGEQNHLSHLLLLG